MPVINLIPVDITIASSYDRSGKTGGPRANLVSLFRLGKAGIISPEAAPALLALSEAALAAGGDFRITECHRDFAVQFAARQKYENWKAAGEPKPGTSAFNSKTMKAAYVAKPGRSGHNAGRSIDVDIGSLKFPGVAADKQLDKLWDVAVPLGWKPIIKGPDERASEAWHFDYPGELQGVKDRLGYEQWALCGAILVGHGDLSGYDAELQALLCRAGFDIGNIDGAAGRKTRTALSSALGISDADAGAKISSKDSSIFSALLSLAAK